MLFWNSLAFSVIQLDVGNLISGSSAFSKTSLNIWKFTVHVLLKPGLENFEHYFTSVWNEGNHQVYKGGFWSCRMVSTEYRDVRELFLCPWGNKGKVMRMYREMLTLYKQLKKEGSGWTLSCLHLDLGLPILWDCKKLCCWSHQSEVFCCIMLNT